MSKKRCLIGKEYNVKMRRGRSTMFAHKVSQDKIYIVLPNKNVKFGLSSTVLVIINTCNFQGEKNDSG